MCVWKPFPLSLSLYLSFYRFPSPLPFPERLTQDSQGNIKKYEKIRFLGVKIGFQNVPKPRKTCVSGLKLKSRNELQHLRIPEDRFLEMTLKWICVHLDDVHLSHLPICLTLGTSLRPSSFIPPPWKIGPSN